MAAVIQWHDFDGVPWGLQPPDVAHTTSYLAWHIEYGMLDAPERAVRCAAAAIRDELAKPVHIPGQEPAFPQVTIRLGWDCLSVHIHAPAAAIVAAFTRLCQNFGRLNVAATSLEPPVPLPWPADLDYRRGGSAHYRPPAADSQLPDDVAAMQSKTGPVPAPTDSLTIAAATQSHTPLNSDEALVEAARAVLQALNPRRTERRQAYVVSQADLLGAALARPGRDRPALLTSARQTAVILPGQEAAASCLVPLDAGGFTLPYWVREYLRPTAQAWGIPIDKLVTIASHPIGQQLYLSFIPGTATGERAHELLRLIAQALTLPAGQLPAHLMGAVVDHSETLRYLIDTQPGLAHRYGVVTRLRGLPPIEAASPADIEAARQQARTSLHLGTDAPMADLPVAEPVTPTPPDAAGAPAWQHLVGWIAALIALLTILGYLIW